MLNRIPFLMFGRRFHNLFRTSIENGDGRDEITLAQERPIFEHYACVMYLSGCLAYLESTYGRCAWNINQNGIDLDTFTTNNPAPPKTSFSNRKISKASLDALVCIRNAVIHNNNDLAQNNDTASLSKVIAASIDGVSLNGSIVTLSSTQQEDFMSHVRLCLVAVAQFYGDG